jgi:hypothetical protein
MIGKGMWDKGGKKIKIQKGGEEKRVRDEDIAEIIFHCISNVIFQ